MRDEFSHSNFSYINDDFSKTQKINNFTNQLQIIDNQDDRGSSNCNSDSMNNDVKTVQYNLFELNEDSDISLRKNQTNQIKGLNEISYFGGSINQ